jgi:AraC-like DNA-binding protein
MLVFFSILGILLSVILLYYNVKKNQSTLYLGLFFLFLSLYSLLQYILLYSKSVTLISIFLINFAILSFPVYLIGPMFYWYFRSVLKDDTRLTRRDIWHLLPMIIYLIIAFPQTLVPWQEKMEAARALVKDTNFLQEFKATILADFIPVSVEYLIRPLLVLGYTLWSAGLFINFLVKGKAKAVFSKQQFMKTWLFHLLGFLIVLVVTQILLIFRGFDMHFSDLYFQINVVRVISAIGLIGLLITPFFLPSILYGLPRVPQSHMEKRHGKRSETLKPDRENRNHNHFEKAYLVSIGQKVDVCMKEHECYLQPECNLDHLAVQVNLPVHHLAYYFREIKKQHFTDYRNEWRVNHAKKLILEGKIREMTLEGIGLKSGFASRNTFLAAFKRMEGTSPHAYASLQKGQSKQND